MSDEAAPAPSPEAPTPTRPAEEPEQAGLAEFTAWFKANYPGPDTVIARPEWHAPKVFRAAMRCIPVPPTPVRAPAGEGEALIRQLVDAAYEVGGATLHANSALSDQQKRYWTNRRAELLDYERRIEKEVLARVAKVGPPRSAGMPPEGHWGGQYQAGWDDAVTAYADVIRALMPAGPTEAGEKKEQ